MSNRVHQAIGLVLGLAAGYLAVTDVRYLAASAQQILLALTLLGSSANAAAMLRRPCESTKGDPL